VPHRDLALFAELVKDLEAFRLALSSRLYPPKVGLESPAEFQ
jgi:hypothetical protein